MESAAINWAEVLVALALRFIGVFIVLAFLMVSIQIAGSLITRTRQGRSRAPTGPGQETTEGAEPDLASAVVATEPNVDVPDEETAAAIALALEGLIRERTAAGSIPVPLGPALFLGERDRSWKILGRQEALQRDAPWKDPMRRRAWTPTGSRER